MQDFHKKVESQIRFLVLSSGTFKNNYSVTRWLTWILLKYCPASKGITLYVEIPVMGSSVGLVAV